MPIPTLRLTRDMHDDDGSEVGLAIADRFFDGLLAGDLGALRGACAPGSVLWINLTEQERPLEASLPAFAQLRSRVPDLRMEAVRRRGLPGGFVEQHVLIGTAPDGTALRVAGCFIGVVAHGLITRLEEYVDGTQAAVLSALLRSDTSRDDRSASPAGQMASPTDERGVSITSDRHSGERERR